MPKKKAARIGPRRKGSSRKTHPSDISVNSVHDHTYYRQPDCDQTVLIEDPDSCDQIYE